MMMSAFSPAAAIAAIKGGTPIKKAQTLMTDKRRVLLRMLSVISGKQQNEVLKQDALVTVASLVQWLENGGQIFLHVMEACGAELVCEVLYEYRPEDVDALVHLVSRKRKKDFSTHYIADALRLLVLSKLEKGSRYPALRELLEPEKEKPQESGMDVLNRICDAVIPRRKENPNDNRSGP